MLCWAHACFTHFLVALVAFLVPFIGPFKLKSVHRQLRHCTAPCAGSHCRCDGAMCARCASSHGVTPLMAADSSPILMLLLHADTLYPTVYCYRGLRKLQNIIAYAPPSGQGSLWKNAFLNRVSMEMAKANDPLHKCPEHPDRQTLAVFDNF